MTLSTKEIKKIRRLAKTMRLKDIAQKTRYGYNTVLKYAKGIRPRYNSGTLTRPNNPCPACSSIRVVSDGMKNWRCQTCGRKWRKNSRYSFVTLKEHNEMIRLKGQGSSYSQIAKTLKRARHTIIDHVLGRILPRL